MVKLYSSKALVFIISVLCFSAAHAQTFKLLKDINTLTHSNPTNVTNKSTEYAVLNGKVYFAADDGVHGRELWVSDGTEAGTKLVKDINPGPLGSHVNNIYTYKDKIYFFTNNDYSSSSALYASDGTAAGTTVIKDGFGVTGYEPFENTQFAILNGILMFTSSNSYDNEEIWRTDGTTSGTRRLVNFNTPEYNYTHVVTNFTLFNGKLYFTKGDFQAELWSTDGTISGTKKFSAPAQFSYIESLAVLGNTLYVEAFSQLWKTNGDSASTKMVNNPLGCSVNEMEVFKNELYCAVGGSGNGTVGVFKYNPASPTGFTLFKQSLTNSVSFAGNANDSIFYFNITTSDTSRPGLWATDGSNITKLLDDNSSLGNYYPFGGKLYFSRRENGAGGQLWISDGSAAGTKKLDNAGTPLSNTWVANFTKFGNKVLFAANTNANGYELWQTAGTDASTQLVKDINVTATASSINIFNFNISDTINSKLVFWANDGIHGLEPWATDGTSNNTSMLQDIYTGGGSGNGANFYNLNDYSYGPYLPIDNRLNNYDYFIALSTNNKYALYKTQGTPATTSFAADFGPLTPGAFPRGIVVNTNKKKLFAIVATLNRNNGLYVYDGLTKPVLLKDSFAFAFARSNGRNIATAGDNTYFFIDPGFGQDGLELWKSDGTTAGTKLVAPLYKGRHGSFSSYLVSFNNKLFFIASSGYLPTGTSADYDNNTEYLWQSDGTAAGTTMLKKVSLNEAPLVICNNKLYFIARDNINGEELWVTDGTSQGTHIVKDIATGTASAGVYGLVNFKGSLYFSANDGSGQGLWKTNGTDTGTVFIAKGGGYSNISSGTKLYFINNNKIWQSDGTAAGTKQMDTTSLAGLIPYNLLYANNRLYFTATSYAYGAELYTTSEKLLPVTFLNFTGTLKGNDALLQWQTANELHNDYFNVQRSTAGSAFTTIGRVHAKNGSDNNYYNFTDAGVTALGVNTLYYRLQQVDQDGKNTYSKTIQLDIAKGGLLKVWPNPATNFTNVYSSVNMPAATIKLTDAYGHTLYNSKHNIPAGGSVTIPLQGYARGVYTVTIQQLGMQKQEYKVVVE